MKTPTTTTLRAPISLLGIFEPDVLLPRQALEHDPPWSPERKLLLALLEDGVKHAIRSVRDDNRDEARRWIRAGGRLTFEFCCEAAGLDPDFIRRGVSAYLQRCRKPPASIVWKRGGGRTPQPSGATSRISAERRREIALMGVAARRVLRGVAAR